MIYNISEVINNKLPIQANLLELDLCNKTDYLVITNK